MLAGHDQTISITAQTFVVLYGLVTGKFSAREAIGGPVSVARIAYEGAELGALTLLMLWAVLSINLFVINMLPIPFLDGGRAVLFIIEGIRRRKLSPRQWDISLRIGLHLVVLLVVFALSNDFMKLARFSAASLLTVQKGQLVLLAAYAVFAVINTIRAKPPQLPAEKTEKPETKPPDSQP